MAAGLGTMLTTAQDGSLVQEVLTSVASAIQQVVLWVGPYWAWTVDQLDQHAGAITAVATAVLAFVTWIYVRLTRRLATYAKASVDATEKLIQAEDARDRAQHSAAVAALFYDLLEIARPMGMILIHGDPSLYVPFEFLSAHRQLIGTLHRGLPAAVAKQVTKTQSLLEVMRGRFQTLKFAPLQLELFYNDDLVPTIHALRDYGNQLGLDLETDIAPIDKGDVALNSQTIANAQKNLAAQQPTSGAQLSPAPQPVSAAPQTAVPAPPPPSHKPAPAKEDS